VSGRTTPDPLAALPFTEDALHEELRDVLLTHGVRPFSRGLAHDLYANLAALPEPLATPTPPTPTSPQSEALREALERVETQHRRGDWTEDGFVGNSVDGRECVVCGLSWPCAAQALRAALTPHPDPEETA
jgi:hypothetical protein